MGTVLKFPRVWHRARTGESVGKKLGAATVIILPVIRIERRPDKSYDPAPIRAQRRRRRPRASRT